MKRTGFIIGVATAIVLHFFLGWQFSVIGAMVAGFFSTGSSWKAGMMALGTAWGLLVLYNFMVAPSESITFIELVGALFGGMPGFVVVVLTVAIGMVLGAAGGWAGSVPVRKNQKSEG